MSSTGFTIDAYTGASDQIAMEEPSIDPNSNHEFTRSKRNGLCCAAVKKAKRIDVSIITILPSDALNTAFTAQGLSSVKKHEARRRLVYKRAHTSYISGVSTTGAIAKRCGIVCRTTYGEAETALSTWLEQIQQQRIADFNAWVQPQQLAIDQESFTWVYVNGLRDHYKKTHTVAHPPAPANDPACPPP